MRLPLSEGTVRSRTGATRTVMRTALGLRGFDSTLKSSPADPPRICR
jgi:hypothetical protein